MLCSVLVWSDELKTTMLLLIVLRNLLIMHCTAKEGLSKCICFTMKNRLKLIQKKPFVEVAEFSHVNKLRVQVIIYLVILFADRGARKAHSKAKKFGGSKKVEGLKSNIKEKMTKIDREVKPLAAEDLSLFARLDALEKEETTNAELDQLDEDNSAEEIKTESGYMKKEDGVRWVQSMTAKDSDSKKKKVTWGASDIKNDAGENVDDANGDSDDDNDVQRTIAVKFSHSSTSFQGQVLVNYHFFLKTSNEKCLYYITTISVLFKLKVKETELCCQPCHFISHVFGCSTSNMSWYMITLL